MLFLSTPSGLAAACALGVGAVPGDAHSSPEEALRLLFPEATIRAERTVLSRDRRKALEEKLRSGRAPGIVSYLVVEKDGRLAGYAVSGDCLGRSEPITYLIALEPDLSVRAVEVLVYRESHGGEIRHPAFRAQYVKKTAADALQVGKDVRNIAGATISCHSLTDAVHDQLVVLTAVLSPGSSAPADPPSGSSEKLEDAQGRAAEEAAVPAFWLRRTQLHMGTPLELCVAAPDADTAARATGRAFAEVRRLERLFSRFLPGSDVARLNAAAGGGTVSVSPETHAVLSLAARVHRQSHGAFDVTVGALHGAASGSRGTDAGGLLHRRARTGNDLLELTPGGARLLVPGAAVDLGGIGKGFALETAAAILRVSGIRRALLDFGGQILALAPPHGQAGWRVGWRDPVRPAGSGGVLVLVQESAATSADYERGPGPGRRHASHLLDPRSGRRPRGVLGVTVVGRRAERADAWSTALFVLGPAEGLDLAEDQGLAVRFDTARGPCWNSLWKARENGMDLS